MKKLILLSLLACAGLVQAQTVAKGFIYQDCSKNGQVVDLRSSSSGANGHEYVDLGLSVKWATMNVGATAPEGYGDYFAWGETTTKSDYSWSTYFDTNDDGSTFTKYNTDGGLTTLELTDDAAHVHWGGDWRMPTKAELQELYDNCTWVWATQNGVKGYRVTSKKSGYTDKSIFLPAAGYRNASDLGSAGSVGGYWSSSLGEGYSYDAWGLGFSSDSHGIGGSYRFNGQSVRPVLP